MKERGDGGDRRIGAAEPGRSGRRKGDGGGELGVSRCQLTALKTGRRAGGPTGGPQRALHGQGQAGPGVIAPGGAVRLRPLHAAVHRLPDPSWNGRGGKRLGCGAARALSGLPRLARALQVFVVACLIDAGVIALLALVRLAD